MEKALQDLLSVRNGFLNVLQIRIVKLGGFTIISSRVRGCYYLCIRSHTQIPLIGVQFNYILQIRQAHQSRHALKRKKQFMPDETFEVKSCPLCGKSHKYLITIHRSKYLYGR